MIRYNTRPSLAGITKNIQFFLINHKLTIDYQAHSRVCRIRFSVFLRKCTLTDPPLTLLLYKLAHSIGTLKRNNSDFRLII